jgi:hypothetical protein
MAHKSILKRAGGKISGEAKKDSRGATALAREAVTAAAMAAAGVVLQGISRSLGGRQQQGKAKESVDKGVIVKGAKKAVKKRTSKRAESPKRPRAKGKSSGKTASKKRTSKAKSR